MCHEQLQPNPNEMTLSYHHYSTTHIYCNYSLNSYIMFTQIKVNCLDINQICLQFARVLSCSLMVFMVSSFIVQRWLHFIIQLPWPIFVNRHCTMHTHNCCIWMCSLFGLFCASKLWDIFESLFYIVLWGFGNQDVLKC